MKKSLGIVVALILVAGCSTSGGRNLMQDNQYQPFATIRAATIECFSAGYFSPEYTQRALSAEEYLRGTWRYDYNKMALIFSQEQEKMKGTANKEECRVVEMIGYNLISEADESKARAQEQRLMKHQYNLQNSALINQKNQQLLNNLKPTTCINTAGYIHCF